MANINKNVEHDSSISKSFSVLRTNPAFTGNSKLIVDSNNDIFLGSFPVNAELSQTYYQKYPLNKEGKYCNDLHAFFGGLPSATFYEVGAVASNMAVYEDYSFQYEDIYQYGASYNSTKLYDEQYKILAPLWLERKMPKKFVIYRVDKTKHGEADSKFTDDVTGQNYRILDMLERATIVKTYNLETSNVGTYLRNHIRDDNMPQSSILFNFNAEDACIFNGISMDSGGFASKREYVNKDFIKQDDIEIDKNEFITNAFERNGLVSANLINLEFLFDDHTAVNYEIYRYFGLYVDDIKEGTFEPDYVDSNGLRIKTNTIKTIYDDIISSPPSWLSSGITSVDMIPSNNDVKLPMLNYLKDKNDNFHHVKNNITVPNKLDVGLITLSDFTGKDITNENLTAVNPETSMKGFIKFKINANPNNLDRLFIASKSEIIAMGHNINDLTASADNSLSAGNYSANTFSNIGTTTEVAVALVGALSHIIEEDYGKELYKVSRDGDSVIIEDYATNTVSNKFGIGIYNTNVVNFITIENATTNNMGLGVGAQWTSASNYLPGSYVTNGGVHYYTVLGGTSGAITPIHSTFNTVTDGGVLWTHITNFSMWTTYTPRGGGNKNNCFLVETKDIGLITSSNIIKEINTETYSNILDIVPDPFEPGLTRIIYDAPIKISNDNIIKIYEYYKTEFGKFSAYDIKDFNFDFYDTSNSSIGDLSYEKSYTQTYPGTNNKLWVATSSVFGIGDIIFTSLTVPVRVYEVTSIFPLGQLALSGGAAPTAETNNVVNGTLVLNFLGYVTSSSSAPIDESITDYWKKLSPVLEIDSDEDFVINRISSEYDRLKENSLKETATKSRDVPYIMKFSLKEGHNARRLPYILNVSEALGVDNLSPNINRKEREPYHLAMEYFDFVKFQANHPALLTSPVSKNIRSYLDFTGGASTVLDAELLKDTTYDYFTKYFNWCGYYNPTDNKWVDDKTYRTYTKFSKGNNIQSASTVYRGLRYVIRDRKEFNSISPMAFSSSSKLNNYKFGIAFVYNIEEAWAQSTAYNLGDRRSADGGSYRCIVAGTSGPSNPGDAPSVSSGEFEDTNSPSTPKLKWEYVGLEGNSKNIRVIKNDTFKFICILIEVVAITNEISNMYRNTLYKEDDVNAIWNFPTNNGNHTAVDTPVTSYFDFLNLLDYSVTPSILEVSSYTVSNGQENLINEITPLNDGTYSVIEFTAGAITYRIYIDSVVSSTQLKISNIVDATNANPALWTNATIASINALADVNLTYDFKYIKGGESAFKRLLDDLTASAVADKFNSHDGIEYISVSTAGTYKNRFTIEIEDGVDFVKPSTITTVNDNARPKSYMLGAATVGNSVSRKKAPYYTELRRFNGEYNPLFSDVITFTDSFNRHKIEWTAPYSDEESRRRLIYDKFNGEGITFASHKKIFRDYGKIKNYFYHKVNDENTDSILKLSESTDKQPQYPLIGEIAIGKKDINVFDSKYMSTYFSKAVNAQNSVNVYGTLSPIEKKAFMSSTVMKVKDTYDLISHSATKEVSLDVLDDIKMEEKNSTDIHWYENDEKIYIDFYADSSIINKLKSDGIASKFSNYVNAINSYGDITTISDDLEIYITSNIVNRFILDSISLYGISGRNISSNIISASSIYDFTTNSFETLSNYEIHSSIKEGISFRIIYNKKLGYYYQFKIHVKIQA